MRPAIPRLAVAVLLAFGLLPRPAAAQWMKLSSGSSAVYLNSISTPDGIHLFTAGDDLDQSGTLPTLQPSVYESQDSGDTFSFIAGSLASLSGYNSTSAVAFFNAQIGWVAIGDAVYATTNAGTQWSSASVGFTVAALAALDATHAVAGGASGAISTTSDGGGSWTPATVPSTRDTVGKMFFLDTQRGWATAQYANAKGAITQADVFRTTDGGQTWVQGWSSTSLGFGPIFFLADGMTGWLAALKQTGMGSSTPDPNQAIAHLLATTDGGDTFTDLSLPTAVGQVTLLGTSSPLNTAQIYAQFWDDNQVGHLVGGAYLGSETTSSSGGNTSTSQTVTAWRLIDYLTSDGGQSWTMTNLGTIAGSLTGLPPSDGVFSSGVFTGFYSGWLAADSDTVWGYSASCKLGTDCVTGYECVSGTCTAEVGSAGPDAGVGGGSFEASPTGSTGRSVKPGCSCTGVSGAPVLALLALLRRRRRRS